MVNAQLSTEFDILYSNISSNQAPGLTEYEKSVFLTYSQKELVIGLYAGTMGEYFESSEALRRYLDSLIKTKKYTKQDIINNDNNISISDNSYFFKEPEDLAFITMEQLIYKIGNCTKRINVMPVKQDEYNKVKDNPFRGVTKYKALRIDSGNGLLEIVSAYDIDSYIIKYLSKPTPIILENLPEGFSIEGKTEITECTLDSNLYKPLLDRAVAMALATIGASTNK
jgi:hypothetical protein